MRCSHCKRELTHSHNILGLTLGAECVQKYAGLEGYLKAFGLEIPGEFPMVQTGLDSFGTNPQLQRILERCEKVDIKLEMRTDWTTHTTHVTGIRKVDTKRISSYTETRAQFAQSVGAL